MLSKFESICHSISGKLRSPKSALGSSTFCVSIPVSEKPRAEQEWYHGAILRIKAQICSSGTLDYHYTTKLAITKKSGVVPLNPISKYKKWILNHEGVTLGELPGKGNF
ncbi:hypothetical protein QTO34_004520, partial [Cnephaeus nilssonii]